MNEPSLPRVPDMALRHEDLRSPRATHVAAPHAFALQPWARPIALLALGLALCVAPHLVYGTFVMKLMCLALFASAYNLVGGYAGLLSFGHAMFFGGAAYVYAYLVKHLQWQFEPALLAASALAGLLGIVLGAIAIRRQGIYVGMVTLALAQMFYFLCVQLPMTGGEDGIQGVPRAPMLFGLVSTEDDGRFYYVVLLLFLAALALIWRIVRSPFGQMLGAIRDNEQRAVSLGCNVNRTKLLAFVLSATLSGLAGAMFTATLGFASLNGVHWHLSGEVIMMSLIGGLATVAGPLLGAAIVLTVQSYLAGLGQWVLVVQGLVFVLAVLFFPRGIVGVVLDRWQTGTGWPGRLRRRIAARAAPAPAAEGAAGATLARSRRRTLP